MNKNSVICNLIDTNPNWMQVIEDLEIRVKQEGDYSIFNYAITSSFSNPIVQEARGIIIDIAQKEVVCWPFRKFGNYSESYADTIDWSSARVLEKVDGSIIKLWFDKKQNNWRFSTNKTIDSKTAYVENVDAIYYYDIIKSAENFNDLNFDSLDKDCTYIFELVSPLIKVVVDYKKTMLYHLGSRNNLTGEEFEADLGIIKPKSFNISSLEQCIQSAIELNKSSNDDIENEGFVVVDKNYHRVKVKSPDYILMHHITSAKTLSKRECLSLLLYDNEKLQLFYDKCPAMIPALKFYDYQLTELLHIADKMGLLAQKLYKEFSYDRKAVAKVIAQHRLSMVGFSCLERDVKGSQVLLAQPIEKLLKYIPDYESEDLSQLFLTK